MAWTSSWLIFSPRWRGGSLSFIFALTGHHGIHYHNTLQIALAKVCNKTSISLPFSASLSLLFSRTHTLTLLRKLYVSKGTKGGTCTSETPLNFVHTHLGIFHIDIHTLQHVQYHAFHPKMQWYSYLSQHPVQFLGSDVPISIDVDLTKWLHEVAHGGSLLPLHDEAELVIGHRSSTLRPVPLHGLVRRITTHTLKCCSKRSGISYKEWTRPCTREIRSWVSGKIVCPPGSCPFFIGDQRSVLQTINFMLASSRNYKLFIRI